MPVAGVMGINTVEFAVEVRLSWWSGLRKGGVGDVPGDTTRLERKTGT